MSEAVGRADARARGSELGWILSGKLAMTGANAVLTLLLFFGLMELETFGLFAAVVGAQLLLSRLVLFGVDQGVIRLFTVDRQAGRPSEVIGTGLASATALALPVLVLGLAAALFEPLGWPGLALASIALGGVGSALFDYGFAAHLAKLEYRAAGILQATLPVVRLGVTVGVALATPGDSLLPLLAFAGTTLLFGLGQAHRLGWRAGLREGSAPIRRLLGYSRWIGCADVAMVLGLQMGVFLLKFDGQSAEAGVYGFSLQLGLGFFAVYLAFYQTILPRAARISDLGDLPRFLGRAFAMAGVLALCCVPLAVLIGAGLPLLIESWRLVPLDSELLGFAPSFYWFAGFAVLLILEAPLAVTCHYLLRPQLQLLGLVTRCVAIGALGLWLVPGGGAVGAGEAQLLGGLCAFAVLAALVAGAVRQAQRDRACAAS